MKIVVASLLLSLFVGALSCDSDPDQTNEGLYHTACRTGTPVTLNSLAINNNDGTTNYPVYLSNSLNVVLNFTNSANHAWENILLSAEIARYTDIFGFCSWINVPTFGLLDNIDACQIGDTTICPLQPGPTIVKDKIDLSGIQTIINFLSDTEPYRLTLTYRSDGTTLNCVTVEAKIRK